jgi:hypothetical protein
MTMTKLLSASEGYGNIKVELVEEKYICPKSSKPIVL